MADFGEEENMIDPFVLDHVISKAYDRRIVQNPEFEKICSKYWQLLQSQPDANRSSNAITKNQYTALMKRIYKVLLPLYREEEVSKETAQEWIFDARGQKEMNITLFMKCLFRIAHSWAVHIDLDEYIELLEKVYNRITCKVVTRGKTGTQEIVLPRIQVAIFQEKEEEDGAEWESCLSDEYQQDNYEYKVEDDPNEEGKKKRYKRPLTDELADDDGQVMMTVREPFMYSETVQYYMPTQAGDDPALNGADLPPSDEDIETDMLAELSDVYPMGYATEQFICQLKNDITSAYKKLEEDRRKAVAELRRQMFEEGNKVKLDKPPEIMKDPGLLNAIGEPFEKFFTMHDSQNQVRIATLLRVEDKIYNQMRQLFKDCPIMQIRPHFKHPTRSVKMSGSQKSLGSSDPITQISEAGYNPALERRLNYQKIQCQHDEGVKTMFLNVNYLINDPMYETAFRSDVNRLETSSHMAIKESQEGDVLQSHEFSNVTTSFKETIKIMLCMKFQSFYTFKMSGKQGDLEKQRDEKLYEVEKQRKAQAMLTDGLVAKSLNENFDEKNFLKLQKGPFYNYISKDGIKDDDYVHCTTNDLIDAANQEVMRLLVIGKPRSGKTTLAKRLAEKLDLVRIAPEVWLDDLFARIKDREENPPEEEEEEEKEDSVKEESQKDPNEGEPGEPGKEGEEEKKEEPKEPEAPKRDKADMWLTDLEYEVRNKMRAGQKLELEEINQILLLQVQSPVAQTKGYVLDLDIVRNTQESMWAMRLVDAGIVNEENELTHIVEIVTDDEEVKLRSNTIKIQVETGFPFSRWERDERNKPKVVNEDEEEIGNQSEVDPDDPNNKPLVDNEMVVRPCDTYDKLSREIEYYNSAERQAFNEFIYKLYDSTYVKVDTTGMDPDEVTDAVLAKMKPNAAVPLRPIAHVIEEAGSFKELLTAGIDDETFNLPRQWSLWKTSDPVALSKGLVEQGSPEFAAHYANNVFVFQNEENLNEFVKSPWQYLNVPPAMPPQFRILMLGPRGTGVKTQAQNLQNFYGWRVVDFLQIIQDKLHEIMQLPQKLPNNITPDGPCMICLSEQELNEIKEGKPMPSWKFIPWILEYLGVPLKVKPKPPPEPDSETDPEWDDARLKQHRDKIKRKKKEAADAAKAASEAAAAKADRDAKRKAALEAQQNLEELGLQESEEEIIIEDMPIDFLIPDLDQDGKPYPIEQFILIGFPQTEIHCQKLKEYGMDFDRVLFLSDKSEENPGVGITERMNLTETYAYDYEAELEIANNILATIKEHSIEEEKHEIIKEIDCSGSIDEVFIKIRTEIDPFFVQADNPEDIKVSEEYEEDEEKKRIPKSDFGDYCPVTYVDQKFLVKGNVEKELFVFGKRYLFAGDEELEKFKFDPQKYMIVQEKGVSLPLAPPPPKIMVTGVKCSGVTTQIGMICSKFKLDMLELFSEYKTLDGQEKDARKRTRLLDRGFKGIPEPDDPDAEKEVDEEIENDPDDFEKEPQEIKQFKQILDPSKALVIDGQWKDNPDDENEIQVTEPFYTILENARRMPEVVVVLNCKEEVSVARKLADSEADLQQEFEQKMKEREERIRSERETARNEKLAELKEADYEEMKPEEIEAKIQEEMKTWDEERDQQEKDEDEADDEKPDLDRMKEALSEKIKEQHARDLEFLDTMKEALTSKFIPVIELETSKISAEFVNIKLLDKLQAHFKHRRDLIEREQVITLTPKEVPVYEASYTYKQSKFGVLSPMTPYNPSKTKNFAALYRERIFFFSNESERQKFLLEPSQYVLGVEAFPQDIHTVPKISVIGLPSSGKSELCKKLAAITGAVHLQIDEITEGLVDRDSAFSKKIRERMKHHGKEMDDLQMIQVIQKRVEYADCQRSGWILEGFPQTRSQAMLLAKRGLLPNNMFVVKIPIQEVFARTAAKADTEFGCNRLVLRKRIAYINDNICQASFFYQKYYNNVVSIDGMRSKWYVQDIALKAIQANLKARMNFARDYTFRDTDEERPCVMQNLNIDRCYFKQTLSQYSHFCSVAWKLDKMYKSCTHIPDFSVLYKNLFYYFADADARDIFVRNPKKFAEQTLFSKPQNIPMRYNSNKASEISESEKGLLGYCPVTLMDQEKLVKGSVLLMVNYKDTKYIFSSEENLVKFFNSPSRYSKAKLPVKIPPEKKPVTMFKLKGEIDSKTFLNQALGSVVTKGLREIGETRLKYPTLTVKETMLKLFAIFLKAENPANTEYMKKKYKQKMEDFLEKCTVPEELNDLSQKKSKGKWPQFKENYYNELGGQYDQILKDVEKEKAEGFWHYMK